MNTLESHSVPRKRFAVVAELYSSIPVDQQGKAKTLMLGKLNPNSSEHQRLESALVVTPSANTAKSNASSTTQGKPRQAGEMNFFTYLNPLERDLVLPNYKAFPVSSDGVKASPALEPAIVPSSRSVVRSAGAVQRKKELDAAAQIGKPYPTLDMAITYARNLGKAALVMRENGKYVVHLAKKEGFNGFLSEQPLTAQSEAKDAAGNTDWVRSNSSVLAMITEDGAVMRPDQAGKKLALRESPGLSADPFGTHQDVFGAGLANIKDKPAFLRQFELAMRDTAFMMLEASEKEAQTKQQQLKGSVPAKDQAVVTTTAKTLEKLDLQIEKAESERRAFYMNPPDPQMYIIANTNSEVKAYLDKQTQAFLAAEKKVDRLKAQRLESLQSYPLFSQFDAGQIRQFNALKTDAERARMLGGAVPGVLESINSTRKNIRSGALNLWSVPAIVEGAKTGLKVQAKGKQWVDEKAKDVKTNKAIWDIAIAALAIGGAILATVATGGLALAGAGLAVGAGTISAVRTTGDYLTNKAAANTNINRELALQPKDMSGELAWVVVAWVGVGLDALTVIQALKAFKAAKSTQALIEQAAERVAAQSGGTVTKKTLLETLKASTKGERGVENANTLRKIVLDGLPKEAQAQLQNLKVIILENKEFAKRFKQTADAVTTINKTGDAVSPIIYVRRGGNPLAIQEETQHLAQLVNADKSMMNRVAQLSEQNLANWGKFKPAQRAEIIISKLELEINAQNKALQQLKGAKAELQLPYVNNISRMETELRALRNMRKYPKLFEQLPEIQSAIPPRLFSTYSQATGAFNPAKLEALRKTLAAENPELLRQLNTSGHLTKVADAVGYDAKRFQELYSKWQLGRDANTGRSATFEAYTKTSVVRGTTGLSEGTQTAKVPFPKSGTPDQNFAQAVLELEKMPSYTKYVEMLEKEGIAARGSLQAQLEAVMKAKGGKGFATVDDLRHAFKLKFRAQVLAKMTASGLSDEAKHVEFLRITEQLSSGDKGSLAEEWYKLVFSPKATSQVPITKEGMAKQGIEIVGRDGGKVRFADLVDGNKVQEIKNIAEALDKDGIGQFKDYMAIAAKRGAITKDGQSFTIQKITYVFTNPEGVKANIKFIKEQLQNPLYSDLLNIEIFNTKGERMIFNSSNINKIDVWLGK